MDADGSPYNGQTFTETGVTGKVDFVPEPGTLAILAMPLATLAWRRRRRTAAAA